MGNAVTPKKLRILVNNSGAVLMNILIILVIMLGMIGLLVYIQVRGINIMGSSQRTFEAFEVAQGAIEQGTQEIKKKVSEGGGVTDVTFSYEGYSGEAEISFMYSSIVAGSNIAFGSGYGEIGKGAASGGVANYYHILGSGEGIQGQEAQVEVAYKNIVGIQAN